MLDTPVAFFVFNRPVHTARVLARIREAQPRLLLVIADGPRGNRPDDAEKCAAVRRIVEAGIDWQCEVRREYEEYNLGCGRRVATGLNWVFAQVEEAIILEDDCLPDPTFFPYCAELLERYRDDPRVGLISGSHHQEFFSRGADDYYFCRYGNIWGWASWRRAWRHFDFAMSDWKEWEATGGLNRLFSDPSVRRFWRRIWDETYAGLHDTWDYQWTFAYMRQGMLGVLPRVALIENIGFGTEATHAIECSPPAPAVGRLSFPLRHPAVVVPDMLAEAEASRRFFTAPSWGARVRRRLSRLLSR